MPFFSPDMGRIDEVEPHFQQLVEAKKQTFKVEPKHQWKMKIRLANAYNNHAGVQCAQGRYREAEIHNTLPPELKQRWTTEAKIGFPV